MSTAQVQVFEKIELSEWKKAKKASSIHWVQASTKAKKALLRPEVYLEICQLDKTVKVQFKITNDTWITEQRLNYAIIHHP